MKPRKKRISQNKFVLWLIIQFASIFIPATLILIVGRMEIWSIVISAMYVIGRFSSLKKILGQEYIKRKKHGLL